MKIGEDVHFGTGNNFSDFGTCCPKIGSWILQALCTYAYVNIANALKMSRLYYCHFVGLEYVEYVDLQTASESWRRLRIVNFVECLW